MLDQIIEMHKDAEYIHIGCDEVYHKLAHKMCSNYTTKIFDQAFLK